MSVIDKIKDSNIGKDVRNTMVGIAAAVASVAPVQAQEHKEGSNDRNDNKTEIRAEVNQTREDTASTINFMDVVNEQRAAEANAWETAGASASQDASTQVEQDNLTQAQETSNEQVAPDRVGERQIIADILDARGDGEGYLDEWDIEQMAASGETTKEDDTQDAKEGVRIWDETGHVPTRTFNINQDNRNGFYSPGDDYVNILEKVDDKKAEDAVAGVADEEIRNCKRDALTFDPMQYYIRSHEGHHLRNFAGEIYSPSSDTTWVGCEATAKIDAADEIGARIAELNFVRDTYIRAGGGAAGLAALQEIASIPSHNSMINGYINMIETGQINPMSTNPDDQKNDFAAMGRLAYEQWKEHDERGYIQQMMRQGLRGAIDNHLPNVQKDDEETRRLCHQAMTLNVTGPNGEQQRVDFGNYVPEVTLPEGLSTALRTLDDNPDLVAEYAQNGSQAFRDKTDRMQRTVDASKGHVATNNNKSQDKVQTNTQTNTQMAMQTNTQTNKQDREAMIQQALRKSRGR